MINSKIGHVVNLSNKTVHLAIYIEGVVGYFTKESCNTDQISSKDKSIGANLDDLEIVKNGLTEIGYELCENCWPK